MSDDPMTPDAGDDLSDHEKMIADAAKRMQARGVKAEEIGGFIQRAQDRLRENEAERPLSRGQLATGMARGVGQGLTFNFADELEGLARGMMPGHTVNDEIDKVRGEQNTFRQKEPVLSAASEIAGSVVPGIGAARLALSGTGAARLAGRVAASGAGAGALAGAGSGEGGVGERAAPAALGAGTGALLGYAGGKAVQGVQRLAPKVTGGLSRLATKLGVPAVPVEEAVPDAGSRKVLRAMEAAKLSIRDLAPKPGESAETMVVDRLGTPGARQARGIRALGGEPGEVVDAAFKGRQQGQQGRIVSRLYGNRGTEDAFTTAADLQSAQLQAAAPLYEQAHAHGAVDDPAINKILQNKDIGRLWTKARGIAEKEALASELGGKPGGYTMPSIEEITSQRATAPLTGDLETVTSSSRRAIPDVKALDYLKQAMDDEVTQLAGKTNEQRAMRNLRERLLNRMDEIVPVYKQARAAYAGPAQLMDALEQGKTAFRSDANAAEITATMAGLSPSERELYQRGAIDALRARLENVGNHRDIAKLLDNTGMKKRITAVYGKEAADVLNTLEEEARMAETGNFVRGGSPTADKLADAQDMGDAIGDAAQHVAGGIGFGILPAMRRAGTSLLMNPVHRGLSSATAGGRHALAKTLTTKLSDRPAMGALEQVLQAIQAERPAQAVGRSVGGSAAGRLVGGRP